MNFIDLATGWFEISEVSIIGKYSDKISQIFNEVWLSRYPRPRKVIFENVSEFKRNFTSSLKINFYQTYMHPYKKSTGNFYLGENSPSHW